MVKLVTVWIMLTMSMALGWMTSKAMVTITMTSKAMVRGDKNDRECAQKLKIERLGLLGLSSVMHRLLFTTQESRLVYPSIVPQTLDVLQQKKNK